jgi:hypothetical protein
MINPKNEVLANLKDCDPNVDISKRLRGFWHSFFLMMFIGGVAADLQTTGDPMTIRTALLSVTAALAFFSLPVTPSLADTYLLTSDHCTGGCLTDQAGGIGGSVTVTQSVANTLSFSVDLLNGNQFVSTGFPLTFGFSLSGNPSITYAGLSSSFDVVGSATNTQTAGSFNMDGFGVFEYGVTCSVCQGGSNPQNGPLTFSITGSGLTLSSFELSSNPPGDTQAFFAVDIISGTTGNTGLIDASTRAVPGPIVGASLPALIMACTGLLALGRRRRQLVV